MGKIPTVDVKTSGEWKLEKPIHHKVKPNIAQRTELMRWIFTPFKLKSMPREWNEWINEWNKTVELLLVLVLRTKLSFQLFSVTVSSSVFTLSVSQTGKGLIHFQTYESHFMWITTWTHGLKIYKKLVEKLKIWCSSAEMRLNDLFDLRRVT